MAQDAHSTRFDTSEHVREAERARELLIDQEITDLRLVLERMDGLTHDVRQRLRRIEHHRRGIAPEWTARNT